MPIAALALLFAFSGGSSVAAAVPATFQSSRDGGCADWRTCRELALAAAERGEFGTFHDLAWRAVQTGPPKDPSLMYLLARAQALSGRPHDALIMLQRLTEMGVASDAATNEDFTRVRELRDWPALEARIAAAVGVSLPSPRPAVAPPAAAALPPSSPPVGAGPTPPPSTVAPPSVAARATATQAVRFSTKQFAVSGLAYDAPSRRFVLGDRLGRRLIVVDETSSHAIDLVRADSAGFLDIAAVEIDAKRGDLWVASSAPANGAGTLHRLQLVSGRPLRSFNIGADLEPVKLVDLAIGPGGAILVLDSLTPQLLVLPSGGTALERVVRIDVQEPVSVAVRADDAVAFVAHRDGMSRIDLRARTVSRVAAPAGVSLGQLERIRWRRNGLIAVQVDGDGSRRIIRLEINARGSSVTRAINLEIPPPAAGQTFVTVSGDELIYLNAGATDASARSSSDVLSDQTEAEFVASRAPLP